MSEETLLTLVEKGDLEGLKQLYTLQGDKKQFVAQRDQNGNNALSLALKFYEAKVFTQIIDNEGNSLLHIAALSLKKFGPPKIEQFQSWKDRLLQNAKRVFDEILDKQTFKINSKPIQIPEEVVDLYFQDPSIAIFRNLLLQAKQNKTVLDLLNEMQKELPTVKQYMEEEASEKKSKRRLISQLSREMLSKILEYL